MNSTKKNAKENPVHNDEPITLPDINLRIAELAYYKSESRGFEPGYELNDWLEAERELIYCGNN
ncbi:DUF2934 domain-containing protein [Methylomonas koyamae]|uniref:DUF2934 domain-containing protein n=1 Tax=Methylomonas koyamae TaxID=702114 RepID=UPI001126F4C8|nr:DUF2934 domain-containing protein [Methylomonas koyamae]TPQ24744.1 hypothetical protein C2U68_17975 [Methylomonas koyamae]